MSFGTEGFGCADEDRPLRLRKQKQSTAIGLVCSTDLFRFEIRDHILPS